MTFSRITKNAAGQWSFTDRDGAIHGTVLAFKSRREARYTRARWVAAARRPVLLSPIQWRYNFENKRLEGTDNLTRWVPRTPRGVNTICKCGNCTRHNKGD